MYGKENQESETGPHSEGPVLKKNRDKNKPKPFTVMTFRAETKHNSYKPLKLVQSFTGSFHCETLGFPATESLLVPGSSTEARKNVTSLLSVAAHSLIMNVCLPMLGT